MKKLIAILLVSISLFSITACTAQDAVDLLDAILEDPYYDTTDTEAVDNVESYTLQPDTTADQAESVTDAEEPATDAETEAVVEITTEEITEVTTEAVTEATTESTASTTVQQVEEETIDEFGTYSSKEDVALYIFTYGHLPQNFITKKAAEGLGWTGGSLEPYAPGKCIGGSRFGNYEGLLPEKTGRKYIECDINTLGAKSRGAERIVFSNDGLIYYTGDHYQTFELLYGEVD